MRCECAQPGFDERVDSSMAVAVRAPRLLVESYLEYGWANRVLRGIHTYVRFAIQFAKIAFELG